MEDDSSNFHQAFVSEYGSWYTNVFLEHSASALKFSWFIIM